MITIALALSLQLAPTAPLAFETFPVSPIFAGRPVPPDLASHPLARVYKTVLRREATKGPNFAGHYTIVRIGCGTGCARIAVVDAGTGRVFFPRGLSAAHWAGWWHDPYGPQYTVSSRLLILSGQANTETAPFGISYFEWTGKDFRLLKFVRRDRGTPPK
jgi:hypothetical protein